MTDGSDPRAHLVELLQPVLATIAGLRPQDRADATSAAALVDALERELPFSGAQVQAIGAAVRRGVAEGWLCDRGAPEARFSRVAKPGAATRGLSIDVVSLEGSALHHRHPQGEVTLAFAADPATAELARFDARPPGWVFCRPGSSHTPTVTGARMHLLYVLPDGAIEWDRPPAGAAAPSSR